MSTVTSKPTDRTVAMAAGYYVQEGASQGTQDDCLGRWYIGHRDAEFDPQGAGYPTHEAAWKAAARLVRATAADPDT